MRKLLISITLLLCCLSLFAKPAKPGYIKYKQPDGTTIEIMRHGDEWASWTTNRRGQVIHKDADGFFREVSGMTPARAQQMAAVRRRAIREMQATALVPMRAPAHMAFGQKHFLVILVEFSDLDFTIEEPQQAISAMLNQNGYSQNGATGSARDYYYDNSHGLFEPIFDVVGPVKLEKDKAYYGHNVDNSDANAAEAIRDGCVLVDDVVDFSNYDLDGDGEVDLVYVIYAGFGEADSSDDDSIWPHQWYLSSAGYSLTQDETKIDRYACGSELMGDGRMDSIGTICHEFGHAMGLPDFYDSDYGENGETPALFYFSLMCSGSYVNDGWTPPYLNIMERTLLGWVDESALQEFPKDGVFTLTSVDDNLAYKTLTDTEGEYFIYECRDNHGWDQYVPATGLLVYHVDQSNRKVSIKRDGSLAQVEASYLWEHWRDDNSINENGSHPCFYIIPSADQSNLMFGYQYYEGYGYYYSRSNDPYIPFPGRKKVTTYVPVSWNGVSGDVALSEIAYAGGKSTFRVRGMESNILDYPVINNPGKGNYTAGSVFALELNVPDGYKVGNVRWLMDGTQVTDSTVTLTAGQHVIEAEVTRQVGEKDIITLEIAVK